MDHDIELAAGSTQSRRDAGAYTMSRDIELADSSTASNSPTASGRPQNHNDHQQNQHHAQRNHVVPLNDTATINTTDAATLAAVALKRRTFLTQKSTVATRRQQAICVRRAQKQYGSKKSPNVVLDGLNMTVPKGTIYGLLGASGCGKTTLLSCIVGRRRLDNGEIWVLGGHPGKRGSGVPGPRIGYMPQELALYSEFTMRETLIYFGWVAGMTTSQVDARMEFLCNMLQLPSPARFVNELSGGQQRRVSLAAALLNEPELLILDEPTVGVDPLIRNNIWEHLVEITATGRQTVIITTHYIEETRQAHVIGLMRGGRFLAEESPDNLLQRYACDSLEDVFLKLAVMQNRGKRRRSSLAQVQENGVPANVNPALDLSHDHDDELGEISGEFGDSTSLATAPPAATASDLLASTPLPEVDEVRPMTTRERLSLIKGRHVKALIWKNCLWMWRNPAAMSFIVGLPMLQIIVFCLCIGHDPYDLKLAVCNHELNRTATSSPASGILLDQSCEVYSGCNYTQLSCRYLSFLQTKRILYDLYDTEEAAYEEVLSGRAWGTIVFPANYSDSMLERSEMGRSAESWTLDYSLVNVRLDQSNQQISTLLWRDLQYVFFDYIGDILASCDYSPSLGKIPVRFEQPVYGDRKPDFTDFAAPGIILTVVFFLAVALTSGAMIIERNEGMLERCLVSGISVLEILFSHVTTQFVVMLAQVGSVLLFGFPGFQLTLRGPAVWMVALVVLTGFCGMCYGFLVSSACGTERTATYLALGSFLPIVMLCGIIWPIEAMWPGLRWVASLLPLTQSVESLRSITQRGWGMERRVVWVGFVSTGAWVAVFLTLSIVLLKFRKN